MKKLCPLLLLLLLLLSACAHSANDGYTIPVVLQLPNGITAADGVSRDIPPGEDAVFTLTLSPGYILVLPEGCSWEDGRLTVHDVRMPLTLSLALTFDAALWPGLDADRVPAGGEFAFSVTADSPRGSVTASHADGSYPAGTEITLSAVPNDTCRFVCWSIGGPVAEGGVPVSDAPDYRFRLGLPLVVCANFADAHTATLIYDANGGSTAAGGRFLREDSDLTDYLTPHTLPARGQLVREGYLLYAYNTAPDGSGREYTFGANVPITRGENETLYAMWAKADETVFTWRETAGRAEIISCTADTETVVLPAVLGGLPVEIVRPGAFSNLPHLRTLILPPSLVRILPGAIQSCPNFTTLYLCDSIRIITDDFYADCPEFRTLKLGAVREPTYLGTRHGSYVIKFQRLISTEGPKLILISGSSSAHGLSTPQLEEKLGGRFSVVGYGTSQKNSSALFLEIAASFVAPGDVVIAAPEPNVQQLGGSNIIVTTFQDFEGALEAFSYVDIRDYRGLFSALTDFNATRDKMKPVTYAAYDKAGELNAYGEIDTHRPTRTDRSFCVSPGSLKLDLSLLSDAGAARLNARFDALRAAGADVYLSFAPMNVSALGGDSVIEGYRLRYQKHLESKLNVTRITDIETCIYESIYINDHDMHLNTEGTAIRMARLADDIITQRKKEGKWT